MYVLSYLYQNNQTLKVLNLAYNGLANEGAVAIADALKVNSTLEELDIRSVIFIIYLNSVVIA